MHSSFFDVEVEEEPTTYYDRRFEIGPFSIDIEIRRKYIGFDLSLDWAYGSTDLYVSLGPVHLHISK